MTKEHSSARLVYWLIGLVTVLIFVFSTLTIIQIRWTTELQTKLKENRQQIQSLRTKCAEKLLQDMIHSEHSISSNRNKRQGGSLQQMLQEMMVAQEKVLLSHCLNNTGLCVKGKTGQQGLKGDMGISGNVGMTGPVGKSGLKGDMGPPGPVGDKGDRGLPGNRGTHGLRGPTGPRGPKGYKGQHGTIGPKGGMGLAGVKGDKGAQGDIGLQGTSGTMGNQGLRGDKGDSGPVGLKGTMGPPGPKGQPGALLQKGCMCIKKPVIDTFPISREYSIGSHVTLTCDSSSKPKPKIKWYLPTNGCATKSVAGKVLDIHSLQPSQLGQYRCDATNIYGTISKTFNLQSNVTHLLDCDFENPDMCVWSNDPKDIGNWQLHHGSTSTSLTGPKTDHTKGSASGYYLYTDSLTNRRNNPVLMKSPELGASGPACLSFWYHMYGRDEGSLVIQTKNNCNGKTTTFKTISDNQGDEWHLAEIQLPALPKNHTIMFKSVQGNGILSDVAVDDVKHYEGQCNVTLFRTGPAEQNITVGVGRKLELDCGIEGFPQPTIHWNTPNSCATNRSASGTGKRMSNQRSYIGSYGNTGANTYGNTGGGSYGNTGGGSYGNTGGGSYGNTGGGSYGNTGGGSYGNTGGGYYGKKVLSQPQVQLTSQDTSQVSSRDTLAVTNYTVYGHEGTYTCTATTPGAQSLSTTFNVKVKGSEVEKCTFESGLCGWTQDKTDIFDWTMQSGPTGSVETGPSADHTTQSSRGKYMYIEASSPRRPGNDAVMTSHLMKANQSSCFSFYTNMYGADTGDLTVMIEDVCTHKQTTIFSERGDQGQSWLHHSINISANSVPNNYHVRVRATVGGSFHSDIAIDDLVLSNTVCNTSQAPHSYAQCDFDNGLCLWTQSSSDNFNWIRHSGSTASSSTGPYGDHTSSGGHGYYLYTEASNQHQFQKADLVSPVIPGLDQDYCLHVATNMYGSTMGSITVYTLENGQRQQKTRFSQRSSSAVWIVRTVNLGHHTSPFQVIIEGVIGSSYYSDASIDDVKVTSGPC